MNHTGRLLAAAVSLAAVASLAMTACSPAPALPAEEKAAVLNWLAKTNEEKLSPRAAKLKRELAKKAKAAA